MIVRPGTVTAATVMQAEWERKLATSTAEIEKLRRDCAEAFARCAEYEKETADLRRHIEWLQTQLAGATKSIFADMSDEQRAAIFGSDEGECHGKPPR